MASSSSSKYSGDDEICLLFHEQHRELASAVEIEDDLDLAYNLQLQEALNASIVYAPLKSKIDMDFLTYSPAEGVTVEESEEKEENGVRVLMKFMDEDAERLEQEVSDREMSEAEFRRMVDELNRRVHDQKVAAALHAIPDEEWENTGDYFQKPYGGGGGSGGVETDENFRVYVKGIVSDERVKDKVVTVAGIGVAICDPRNYCVLELRKPVVDEDGGKKDVLSVERVGFEALVEGLKAADGLGLKRISCFCDEQMIHQYVSTNQLSTDFKVTMLAFEALTLRKKLVHFDITLVGQNEIQIATKLARDAIVSQICVHKESEKGKQIVETCVICLEDTVVSDMFMIEGCLHRYCFSCMKQHVKVRLLNGKTATCPHENCQSEMTLETCKSFLEPQFIDLMIQRMKEAALPPTEKVYCPYPRCSALMSKKEVIDHLPIRSSSPKLEGLSQCTKCNELFCRKCLVPWHKDMTCDAYQTSYKHSGESQLKSLANLKHWRQCIKCSNMIELAEGCNHIYCRCGYEFCYVCCAEWKDKKATCGCPLWDERFIIRR